MSYARRATRWVLNAPSIPAISSPTDVANLWAWFDASDISSLYQDSGRTTPVTTNGDPVGSWSDKSGNARHANQVGAAATRPTYTTGVQNGLAACLYDGGDYLDTAATVTSFPLTIMAVTRTSSTVSAARGLVTNRHSTNFGARIVWTASNLLQANIDTPSATLNSVAAIGATTAAIVAAAFDTTTIRNMLNGALRDGVHGATGVTNIVSLGRGNVNLTAVLANGHLAEVVIYNRALSDTEMLQVSTYLNTKWAVY